MKYPLALIRALCVGGDQSAKFLNVQVMQLSTTFPLMMYEPVQQTAWSPPQLGEFCRAKTSAGMAVAVTVLMARAAARRLRRVNILMDEERISDEMILWLSVDGVLKMEPDERDEIWLWLLGECRSINTLLVQYVTVVFLSPLSACIVASLQSLEM